MQLTKRNAEILLASVIAVRATSYMFSKLALSDMGPLNLLGVRFTVAFLIMAVIFRKQLVNTSRSELLSGIIIGTSLFAVMACELFGLRTTTSSVCSFLENTAIVFVPLFTASISKKIPSSKEILTVLLAFAGVALITLNGDGFGFGKGEALCLTAAILYAVTIIITDRVSKQGNPLNIGMIQIATVGILGLISSLIFETPHLPSNGSIWLMILILAVVCTAFGFTLQPVAQSRTDANKAGLFISIAPAISLLCGAVFLHETVTYASIAGCILILLAIVMSSFREIRSLPSKMICSSKDMH